MKNKIKKVENRGFFLVAFWQYKKNGGTMSRAEFAGSDAYKLAKNGNGKVLVRPAEEAPLDELEDGKVLPDLPEAKFDWTKEE